MSFEQVSNTYEYLGAVKSYHRDGRSLIFDCGGAQLSVTALNAGLVRVRVARDGQFAPRRSWSIARPDSDYAADSLFFAVMEPKDAIELTTELLTVRIERNPCRVSFVDKQGQFLAEDDRDYGIGWRSQTGQVINWKIGTPTEHYYGFGERTSLLDKRSRRYTNWGTDPFLYNNDHGPGTNQMYQAIPFFMGLRYAAKQPASSAAFGIYFNNTYETSFDMGVARPGFYSLEAEGGELDYYFVYGPTPAQVVERYTQLTGRMPLPPRWALGYHQSRWSYYPEQVVRELAQGFRERKIPCEVFHLDIDYMRGYRVFTWDEQHFPNPAGLLKDLAEMGIKTITIIDPGVKYDPDNNYGVYDTGAASDYFIRQADGEVFHGYVWPDDSVFPDFSRPEVREWWGEQHQALLETNVAAIWNDMNEPAINDKPYSQGGGGLREIPRSAPQGPANERTTHAELHNMYATLEAQATYEGLRKLRPTTRPFILTRSGFAGIQKWAAVWTGDNTSFWEHLEMTLPQLANLGLSGVAFAGADIGGFGGNVNAELFARWMELGALYPFARGHSAINTAQKEPWIFGPQTEAICKRYLEWRYRLLPYLYTTFWQSSQTGAPVWRPMLYQFPDDAALAEIHDQVLVGDALMVAPIYRPGQEYRHVYFPNSNFYDFWAGTLITPNQHLLAHAPLDTLPLYGRGGAIVPLGPVMEWSEQRPLDVLTLEVFADTQGNATGLLYEDDGSSFSYQQGGYSLTRYQLTQPSANVYELTATREGQFQPAPRAVMVRLHTPNGLKTANLDSDGGNWELSL